MKITKSLYKISFLLILLQLIACNKTNWVENYREKEKSPFGNYIVYNEAKVLLNNKEVTLLKENIYDYLYTNYTMGSSELKTYVCIKNSAFRLTEAGIEDLLSYVDDGNSAFIALNYFSDALKEKLSFTTNNLDVDVYGVSELKKLQGTFYLENETLVKQPFSFDRNIRRNYFLEYDKNKTIILGTTLIDGEKVPNFIKIYHGKGAIYLHSNPVVFTNYYLLNNKENYIENVFSYLPDEGILWDPQIRSSKYSSDKGEENSSIFKFFLEHKTLTWFLIVTVFGVLLFMLFNARRKQRSIPIINPLKNSTVEFTQTIANLYLKEKDHKNLVDKKITFFLEKVRTKYLIDTSNLNKDFIGKLALKSGNELHKTKYLINTITTLNKRTECIEEELIVLHKMIDNFFKK